MFFRQQSKLLSIMIGFGSSPAVLKAVKALAAALPGNEFFDFRRPGAGLMRHKKLDK
jgi:hypothetical protein